MRVSQHAVDRYIERVKGLDINEVQESGRSYFRKVIECNIAPKYNLIQQEGAYMLRTGIYAIVRNMVVVTIITKNKWDSSFIKLSDLEELEKIEHSNNYRHMRIRKKKTNKERSYKGSRPKGSQKGMWKFKGATIRSKY